MWVRMMATNAVAVGWLNAARGFLGAGATVGWS